jgi:hypothetical protein
MRTWLMLVGLVACTPQAEETAGDTTATDVPADPTPWSYEPTTSRTPTLSAEEVGAALELWVPRMRTFEVEPLFDAYEAVTATGDEACPTQLRAEEGEAFQQNWQADCEAATGATFYGYTEYAGGTQPADDGWTGSFRYVYGVAAVYTPEGHLWRANGYFATSFNWKDDERYWDKNISGEHLWDGPETAGTWVADGLRFSGYVGAYTDGAGRNVGLSAGVSGMTGDVVAVSATDLSMISDDWSPPCAMEPTGTASVRAADGGWYDVVFDPPTWEEPELDPAQCDGCGRLFFEGQELGLACADLSDLMAWTGAPW